MKEARCHAHSCQGEIPDPWPLMTALIWLCAVSLHLVELPYDVI